LKLWEMFLHWHMPEIWVQAAEDGVHGSNEAWNSEQSRKRESDELDAAKLTLTDDGGWENQDCIIEPTANGVVKGVDGSWMLNSA
jgi:hypothetical protein